MGCVDRSWQSRPNGFLQHDISTRQSQARTRHPRIRPESSSPFATNPSPVVTTSNGYPFPSKLGNERRPYIATALGCLSPSSSPNATPDLSSWVHKGNMSHLPRAGSHMVQIETLCWRFAGFSIAQDRAGINIAPKAETKTIEKETSVQLRQLRRATKTRKEERKTKLRLTISKTSTIRRELRQIRAIVDVKVSTEQKQNIRYCHNLTCSWFERTKKNKTTAIEWKLSESVFVFPFIRREKKRRERERKKTERRRTA